MNIKSLLASIGVVLNSLFSPLNVKADVFGDLNTTRLLYPSLPFDSVLVQKDSNLTFMSYPQSWNVDKLSNINNVNVFSSIQSLNAINVSSSNEVSYFDLGKFLQSEYTDNRIVLGDWLLVSGGTNPYRNTYGNSPMFNSVDLTYTSNDFVIKSSDLNQVAFNVYTLGSSGSFPNQTLNYSISFTLNYIARSSGGGENEYVYLTSNLSYSDVVSLDNLPFGFTTQGGVDVAMYSISPFSHFSSQFGDFEWLWISNLVFSAGYNMNVADNSTPGVRGFGWDIPYYNSASIVDNTSYSNWLISNGLDSSSSDVCPPHVDCPQCDICVGGTVNELNILGWLADVVSAFFSVEIFPNFSLGIIFSVVVFILFAIAILKLIAGG